MRTRQRMPWRKAGHALYTDEVAAVLSVFALHLRIFLEVRAIADDAQLVAGAAVPGVGWLLGDDGLPTSVRRIAAVSKVPEAEVERALAELQVEGVAVLSDAGAWGTRGWCGRQETDDAARMRETRANGRRQQPNAGGPVRTMPEQAANSSADVRPGSVEKEERRQEGEQDKTHTPRAERSGRADAARQPEPQATREQPQTAPALVLIEPPPARAPATRRKAKAPLAGSPEFALGQQVLNAWHNHRVELDLADAGRKPELSVARVAEVTRAGAELETWLTVLRRAAEKLRREAEDAGRPARECKGAEYFTLESLGRPANHQRYLGLDFLDTPRRSAAARASPGRAPRIVAAVPGAVDEIEVSGGGGLRGGSDG